MNVWRNVGEAAADWGMMKYYTTDLYPILLKIMNNIDRDDPDTIKFNAICYRASENFTLEFLNAMIDWHNRPWFSRVWVVQEFSLTGKATIVCGNKRVSAEQALLARQVFDCCHRRMFEREGDVNHRALLDAFSALQNNTAQPFFAIRQQRKKIVAGIRAGITLCQLLCILHVDNKMQATEPCDFIWGLLSLVTDSEQL